MKGKFLGPPFVCSARRYPISSGNFPFALKHGRFLTLWCDIGAQNESLLAEEPAALGSYLSF